MGHPAILDFGLSIGGVGEIGFQRAKVLHLRGFPSWESGMRRRSRCEIMHLNTYERQTGGNFRRKISSRRCGESEPDHPRSPQRGSAEDYQSRPRYSTHSERLSAGEADCAGRSVGRALELGRAARPLDGRREGGATREPTSAAEASRSSILYGPTEEAAEKLFSLACISLSG
jgi:hypothetical protein